MRPRSWVQIPHRIFLRHDSIVWSTAGDLRSSPSGSQVQILLVFFNFSERNSAGRVFDCGSKGHGFDPHRSLVNFYFVMKSGII